MRTETLASSLLLLCFQVQSRDEFLRSVLVSYSNLLSTGIAAQLLIGFIATLSLTFERIIGFYMGNVNIDFENVELL